MYNLYKRKKLLILRRQSVVPLSCCSR